MACGRTICLFLVFSATTISAFSVSYTSHGRGRKLFGGYRIVPKVCQPTNPSVIKSDEPAICMFNYECTRRNGNVVGACMDGFLFGACCQLPNKQTGIDASDRGPTTEHLLSSHEIDHVPDIPILLNPDGTPIEMSVTNDANTVTPGSLQGTSIKTPIFAQQPSITASHYTDSTENAEKPQVKVPVQADYSHLDMDFPALLNQQSVLDDLKLPGLLTHSDSNNDIQDHQDSTGINPVTTLLSPDQVLQIADPVDQLPALFSQGLGQHNHSSAETILLSENGTILNESNNPDDLFKPSASPPSSTTQKIHETTQKLPIETIQSTVAQNIASNANNVSTSSDMNPTKKVPSNVKQKITTTERVPYTTKQKQQPTGTKLTTTTEKSSIPTKGTPIRPASDVKVTFPNSSPTRDTTTQKSTTADDNNDLIRVPTITYDTQSGNKKDDVLDHEEMSINHIISILNDTTPTTESQTISNAISGSPIHTWIDIEQTSKPSYVKISTTKPLTTSADPSPYTFYKPAQISSSYYGYDAVPTQTAGSSNYPQSIYSNHYSSRPSGTQGSTNTPSSYSYSTRPSSNPPAPTVIVLGPLGTEYTAATVQKTPTRRPVSTIRPNINKSNISTTITHNINTVISTNSAEPINNQVVSTSYISVNLKDGTSAKPSEDSYIDSTPSSTIINQYISSDGETITKIPDDGNTKKPSTAWTTLTTWSSKPSFHLKPSSPNFSWPDDHMDHMTEINSVVFKKPSTPEKIESTSSSPCDDETAAPDDLINFPPVRNPNLNISIPASQQEKPTIIQNYNNSGYPDIEILSENDIPTPAFIEDTVLTNKVDVFVNKIVESLQDNFEDLKDVVYNKKNGSASSPSPPATTRRPTTTGVLQSTTKKPIRRPTQSTLKPSRLTTRKPATTRRPTRVTSQTTQRPVSGEKPIRPGKPTILRPKPTTHYGVTTKRPQTTTKRTRPTKKPTAATVNDEASVESTEEDYSVTISLSTDTEKPTVTEDFKKDCGVRPFMKTGRIVGGKGAKFGEWPWQVLVREATWLGLFTKNKCGGVLITNKYVITAAHCQPGFLASLVAVFGEYDISGELEMKRSVTRNIRRVIVNRGYDPATFENDLALLELESPIQFDSHIVPICMPEDNIDFTGRMATVTGWGRLKYNGGVPSVLQEVQVPIMENSVCQEMFQTAGHSKLILDSFLCAGYANGQKDSCEGDSGGPLTMEGPDGKWFLVGTVSHGIKCAAPYLPGVYMRTTFFKPWLHSITGV